MTLVYTGDPEKPNWTRLNAGPTSKNSIGSTSCVSWWLVSVSWQSQDGRVKTGHSIIAAPSTEYPIRCFYQRLVVYPLAVSTSHEQLTQCWVIVGPPYKTLAEHCVNWYLMGQVSGVIDSKPDNILIVICHLAPKYNSRMFRLAKSHWIRIANFLATSDNCHTNVFAVVPTLKQLLPQRQIGIYVQWSE